MDAIRPSLIGIGFKWYSEVIDALWLAETIKRIDPNVVTVMGGDTAATYFRELLAFGHVDLVVRGDGELPLLRLCRGDDPVNLAFRENDSIRLTPTAYVQTGHQDEQIYISHLEEMCPRKSDLMSLPNFIVGGRGCAQACLYCSGGRDKQRELFGRKGPFLRQPGDVKRDIMALHPYVGGFFFDFSSEHDRRVSLADWFKEVFEHVDCTAHMLLFLPWELPHDAVIEYLVGKFRYVHVGLDIGTLSERHRNFLSAKGYFKRYIVTRQVSNRDFLDWADRHRGVANLSLALTAISGMPFLEAADLAEEKAFATQILERDRLMLGYEGHRLHFEPGSPVVEHPELFGMYSPINSFRDLVEWFESGKSAEEPAMRFRSEELDELVDRHAREMAKMSEGRTPHILAKYRVPWGPGETVPSCATTSIRLKREGYRQFTFDAAEWTLDAHDMQPNSGDRMVYVKNLGNAGVRIDSAMFTTEHGCDAPRIDTGAQVDHGTIARAF